MGKRMMNFLEMMCYGVGAFLISYIIVNKLNILQSFTLSPELCLIVGVVLICVGFIIQALNKKK